MIQKKFVKAGDWRTLNWFWNVKATLFFAGHAGAQIKVRYGNGWPIGYDSQKQTLDGRNYKKLTVGIVSVAYARAQIRVGSDTEVTYDLYMGDVAVNSPEIPF